MCDLYVCDVCRYTCRCLCYSMWNSEDNPSSWDSPFTLLVDVYPRLAACELLDILLSLPPISLEEQQDPSMRCHGDSKSAPYTCEASHSAISPAQRLFLLIGSMED